MKVRIKNRRWMDRIMAVIPFHNIVKMKVTCSIKNRRWMDRIMAVIPFHRFGSISWHTIWIFRLLYNIHSFFRISNFFGLSTTEETFKVVEMSIWYIKVLLQMY
jgi:hypothetical protein